MSSTFKHIVNTFSIQAKSKTHDVTPLGNDQYLVHSGHSDRHYVVTLHETGAQCTCPWGTCGGTEVRTHSGCSHVMAVYEWLAAQAGLTVTARSTRFIPALPYAGDIAVVTIGDHVALSLRKR